MQHTELREYLTGAREPLETLLWLQTTFLPSVVEELNSIDVRRRLGIYAGEKIPENETNLTDVRNRVSLIIEYELARIATRILEHANVFDLFWSYVVANRFPDLEVRHVSARRGLRVEVKCLQTLAEEKSANFDTLRKDIHPRTDFLVVFLWEWHHDPGEVTWDRAPQIIKVYVFHAASLAHLRDWYWLNSPPSNLGDGLQGYDLRYAVTCANGMYKEEEGNYGKLLRIWQEGFQYRPRTSELIEQTIRDYLVFKTEAITSGLDTLANKFLPILSVDPTITPIIYNDARVGWRTESAAFLLGSYMSKRDEKQAILLLASTSSVYIFTDKYAWVEYQYANRNLTEVRRGKKPKRLVQPAVPGQAGN